jgi:phenylpropionate dioxygenase-like ring-hydroxylating dioxygenase large terminal subunit
MLEKVPAPRLAMPPAYDWDELVQAERVHRTLYTDPNIFALEMTHIFGGTWVYLAHESQIPNNNDFITGKLGLRPLIITRDAHGKIRALYNRCTHRGTTLCRWDKGNSKSFQCPYHGWNFLNTGQLRGVPWPDGYTAEIRDEKFNLAQLERVESYRGFIFGTLNPDMPSLLEWLGPITRPIDDWLDRNPNGRVVICEANRLKYKGNWKLAYDNSADGYHVIYSHRSLIETENRFNDPSDKEKGMAYYKGSPDQLAMYVAYTGNGHHYKDKRPNLEKRAGGLWAIESLHPGMEYYAEKLRARLGPRAEAALDLAGSEPININVFPNLSLLGNHIQVIEPVSFNETNAVWYGTRIEDDGTWGQETVDDINALRMRTQEGFPNLGEVDDISNFEQIQVGLACLEDEWVYMNRGLGLPGRFRTDEQGVIYGPATDEVFMREYIKEWKRLMKAEPHLVVRREP